VRAPTFLWEFVVSRKVNGSLCCNSSMLDLALHVSMCMSCAAVLMWMLQADNFSARCHWLMQMVVSVIRGVMILHRRARHHRNYRHIVIDRWSNASMTAFSRAQNSSRSSFSRQKQSRELWTWHRGAATATTHFIFYICWVHHIVCFNVYC